MADTIKVYRDDAGGWRWSRIAGNGEKVSNSGEAFDSKFNAVRAATKEAGQDAVLDIQGEE